MKNLTLVIASPRSGSTLLCEDIASLGGLGAPQEYFMSLGPNNLTEQDLLAAINEGVQPQSPDTAAVKLMVNYAPRINSAIGGSKTDTLFDAVSGFVGWAKQTFDKVNIVALVRENAVDQALSRILARRSKTYHLRGSGDAAKSAAPTAPDDAALLQFLAEIPAVVRQNNAIKSFAAKQSQCLLLDYDELTTNPDSTTQKLIEHAHSNGLSPINETVERSLKKVVKKQETEIWKESLIDFLRRNGLS